MSGDRELAEMFLEALAARPTSTPGDLAEWLARHIGAELGASPEAIERAAALGRACAGAVGASAVGAWLDD